MEYENVSWIGDKIRGAVSAAKDKIKTSADSNGVNEAGKNILSILEGAGRIFSPLQQGASQNLGQPKVW